MKKIAVFTAFMSATALSLAVPVAAQPHHPDQTQEQTPQGQGMMGQGMMGGQTGGKMMMGQGMMECPMMGANDGQPRTEGRLAFLKAELNISSSQEASWNEYAEAVRSSHESMKDHMAKMRQKMMNKNDEAQAADRIPAPDALNKRIKMMEGMLANLKSVEKATSKLYGKLDQSQKVTADELLGMSCGMMRM